MQPNQENQPNAKAQEEPTQERVVIVSSNYQGKDGHRGIKTAEDRHVKKPEEVLTLILRGGTCRK